MQRFQLACWPFFRDHSLLACCVQRQDGDTHQYQATLDLRKSIANQLSLSPLLHSSPSCMLSNPFMFVHPSPSSARREPPQPVSSSPFAKMNRWCNILLLHCCYYHFAGRCDAFSCTSQLAATSPARRRFCERRSGRPPHGTTSWHPTKLGHQRGSARPLRSTVSDVGVVASSLSEDALVETDDVGDGLPPSHDPWIIQWR